MKRFCKIVMAVILIVSMAMISAKVPAYAAIRATDVTAAAAGNTLIGVKGSFENIEASKILDRINEIRQEACKKGYRNPDTGEKLTMADYTQIRWSDALEWIASVRAVESTVLGAHTRPNGTSCFTVTKNGEKSWGEVLAWNYSGLMQGIEQWYGEKEDWINQNSNAVTGHYTAMISPRNKYVGVAAFTSADGGWIGVAGEFSFENNASEKKLKLKKNVIQMVEVTDSTISGGQLSGASTLKKGDKKTLRVTKKITYSNGVHGNDHQTTGILTEGITWKSSNPKLLTVDDKGKVTAKKRGKVTVRAICGENIYKKTITIK